MRRTPVPETRPGANVFEFFAPPRRRAGLFYSDEPAAGLLTATGCVYYPPMGGARVVWVTCNSATSMRVGLIRDTNTGFSNGAPSGTTPAARPIYADVPLRGGYEDYVFAPGLGDLAPIGLGQFPARIDLEVHPPNLFVFANATDNVAFEGAIYVEEFVDDTLLNL